MNRGSWATLAAITASLLLLGESGCKSSGKPTSLPRKSQTAYVSPEKTFSVRLPEGVTLERKRVGPATGPFLTGWHYIGGDKRAMFTVSVYDIVRGKREEVTSEEMIREHARSANVTLTSLAATKREGVPVSRAVGNLVSDGQRVTWTEEARIHGDRAFLLVAIAVHPEENPDVQAFFVSFSPLSAGTESTEPVETPVTAGQTRTALSISTDGRLTIDGRGLQLPCKRTLLDEMIGPPSREWAGGTYGNTIHTWDNLGIRAYEKTGSGTIQSVVIDLFPGKYRFSPKRVYGGDLTINGVTVTPATTPADVNGGLSRHRFSRSLLYVWSLRQERFVTTLNTKPNGAVTSVSIEATAR